ncbi:hypothetical protein PR003_g14410 [Phytophthora rubi]|uniref:Uncharacterized protein n=1 Tax=Phytophthora rubi TaxID=129364 RepID=A0A6A3LQD7_9STRA|nr:hypothetical protein PR002_g14171 [Phytophthora rubi]KAE9020307.1 hypothetical protein PR001_g13639 [Phytophthora rubi]KAE9332626.1 hypothetical protein PR003_g14410 [Phytophthora rubi]
MDSDVLSQREDVILQEMGWRKVNGLLEFADRRLDEQGGVDDVVWRVAPYYIRTLTTENTVPFQDYVKGVVCGR